MATVIGADPVEMTQNNYVITMLTFFHLQDTKIKLSQIVHNKPYLHRLAFLGDAVLKSYVVNELVAQAGIYCNKLFKRTYAYVSNASLALVFVKLAFETRSGSKNIIKFRGTVIEAMLGYTEMHNPQLTRQVVKQIMNVIDATRDAVVPSKPAPAPKIHVGRAKVQIQLGCAARPCSMVTRLRTGVPACKSAPASSTTPVKKGTYLSVPCSSGLRKHEGKTASHKNQAQQALDHVTLSKHKNTVKRKKAQKQLKVKGGIKKQAKTVNGWQLVPT